MLSEGESELGKLGDLLSNAQFRQAFLANPATALAEAGLHIGNIAPNILDTLKSLTPSELRAVASVGQALRESGVPADDGLRMV